MVGGSGAPGQDEARAGPNDLDVVGAGCVESRTPAFATRAW